MKKTIFFLIGIILTSILACNQGNCPQLYFEKYDLIDAYHTSYFPNEQENQIINKFAIYLDYSSGMKIAFSDKKSASFYDLFINSLKISTVDFYEVDKNEVNKIENLSKSELYKKIKETKRYLGINAPLNKAVNDIVKKNTEAVFITDGELWENQERDDPWAREEFASWLKAGNAIDFFVTDHTDAGKIKHVFYMFFIPKHRIYDKENIANQFRFYLENSIEAKNLKYTQFTFSTNTYKLLKEYKTETSGGVNENAGLDETTYINRENYEYHDYMIEWKDLYKYILEAYDNNGNQIKGGDPIISKLYIETSGLEFYNIEEIGIKVYDIYSDFQNLIIKNEIAANKPTFLLDEAGKKILDENNKPIVDCPGHYDGYNEYGELIADTIFKASQNLSILNEVFAFDNDAFINNYKEQGRGELIIKFHPNFDGTQISSEHENFFRIDVYLKKINVNTSNPDLEKFIWDGKQVDRNRSIYNSVLGALNEANPEGEIIYTYYISTLPFK